MGNLALAVSALLSLGSAPLPLVAPVQPEAREAARRIAATVHLAAQEYALAWEGGALTKPGEAAEAKLFVTEARHSIRTLSPDLAREVARALVSITALLERSAPPESVSAQVAALERRLGAGASLEDRPSREPSLEGGARVYAARCAQCHGEGGRGNGPAAAGLHPPPADLTHGPGVVPVTPLDSYRRLTYGVPGTAMPAFGSVLSPEERWDAIAYVLSFADSAVRRGRNASGALAFATVRGTLGGAMALVRRGERAAGADRVFDAYLAFESVEGAVRIADAGLASRAEARFAALREAAAGGLPTVERRYGEMARTIDSAEVVLNRTHTGWGLLAESFLLIVREGFEAILIVAAIMAVVLRGGSTEQRRSVRWGVVLALAASLATAALLEILLEASAAQREALEGGVMLVAAAVLFYVSYWLISKVDAAAWQRFVREKIERAAASGSGLALASVAFLAVYREGFETVLFYKALYVTGGAGGAAPITFGLAAGGVVLLALYVGIEKFGIRIPLRPFFAVTGATLYFMAFVFAGAGVKELQEGAVIPTTLVPGAPRSEFFGIYPTVESLALQGLIVLSLGVAVVWTISWRRRRSGETVVSAPGKDGNSGTAVAATPGREERARLQKTR
jgi:high-affinity iron transporter